MRDGIKQLPAARDQSCLASKYERLHLIYIVEGNVSISIF